MQILTQQVWGQAGDSVCLIGSLGVQPQHGPIATETRMSFYCSFKSAPPPPSSSGICHAPGHTSDTWPDPRLPVIFFFFLCGKYICQRLVQQKQIFIFEHLLCMLGSLQGPVDTVEAWSQGLLWEPSGMCQPPQVTLADDFSKKNFSFTTCSTGTKAFPEVLHPLFFLKCLHFSTLLICLSDAQRTPIFVNKKTN